MGDQIRFLSLNTGMRSDLAGLTSLISDYKLDLIFLQEIKLTQEELDAKIKKLNFQCSVNNAEDSSKPGTAVLWRSSIQLKEVLTIVVGRAQLVFLGGTALLNIYAPSGSGAKHDRNRFFACDIFRAVNLYPFSSWLVSGDFNAILSPLDVENGFGFGQKNCPMLADLIKLKNLTDVFRHVNPGKAEFTFFRPNVSPSRLDRIYITTELLNEVTSVEHIASLSDHLGVFMEMTMTCVKRVNTPRVSRESYWKLNCSILNDDDFLENFSKLWTDLKAVQNDYIDIADWWDELVKPCIKEFCVVFSKNRSMRIKDTKKFLFAYLKIVLSEKNWSEVIRVKEELNTLMGYDVNGYLIRSRFSNNAYNESASIFHANKEMKNACKNSLSKLKIDGEEETDKQLIENEVLAFFKALFNGHHNSDLINTGTSFQPNFSHISEFLSVLEKLPDDEQKEIEMAMEEEELEEIVMKSSNNKSPGLDGISYELYKTTWGIIKKDLVKVFQSQLNRGRLVASNKEGVTRLCPKVNGIPAVDQLRPITLLNCDYKLLTKWLVRRLRPKLPFVIKSGQLCTVGDKNILFGVSNVISSVLAVKQKRGQACLISLDFFKAYDRVMLSFLLKVLEAMNFGALFISWISMLHEGARTCFILEFLTQSIDVKFSIRQGDPIAMLLYILYVEPLLVHLEKKLTGLRLQHVREVLEAYCDDLNILTDDPEDFHVMSEVVTQFEQFSGAILSRNMKCKVLGLGNWSNRDQWPLPWLTTVKSVKIFGIFISNSYHEIISNNWNFRLENFRKTVMSWSSRGLETLQQRIEVLKVFALSRIYFVASVLPVKKTVLRNIESIMGKFIWQGRLLRVSLAELKNDFMDGGLRLPCLATMNKSLMISQCLRVVRSTDDKSKTHLDFWMGALLQDCAPQFGRGVMSGETPAYYIFISESIAPLIMDEVLTAQTLPKLTNRLIYRNLADFPTPKVAENSVANFKTIWRRLRTGRFSLEEADTLYLLINNKLPVPERLFRVNVRNDPYCLSCHGLEVADISHFFGTCDRTVDVWMWLRSRLLTGSGSQQVSDWDLLNLALPTSSKEKEVVWVIGVYVNYAWQTLVTRDEVLKVEKFFGFLTYKYRENKSFLGRIEWLE